MVRKTTALSYNGSLGGYLAAFNWQQHSSLFLKLSFLRRTVGFKLKMSLPHFSLKNEF